MKDKYKSSLYSVLILLFTLVVGLLFVEFALRIKNSSMENYNIEMWRYSKLLKKPSIDPILGHEHKKNSEAVLQSVKIRINNIGLRGDDISNDKQGMRILFLGSSITLGWGVNEEDTMTRILEKKLRSDGIHAHVYNAGIGNYNTVKYVHRFFKYLEPIKPTTIVVNYFINDAEQLLEGGGNILLKKSQLAVTVLGIVNSIIHGKGMEGLKQHYKKVYQDDAVGYVKMVRSLSDLAQYAKKENINLYMLITPDVHQLKNYPFIFIHEKVAQVARDLGYTVVDTITGFSKYSPDELWAMPGDPHPNKLGHAVMAEAIYHALAKLSFDP